jgi:hypothetical protein
MLGTNGNSIPFPPGGPISGDPVAAPQTQGSAEKDNQLPNKPNDDKNCVGIQENHQKKCWHPGKSQNMRCIWLYCF